ncbi:sensor histidine kinase [Silvanigrella aquatica]|uniref:Histidine kinase domain-containing protein n=1 Tax=Silvanigrella aquatica TaxID=1915309 RepID=A0A1L4CXK7_9BACT|nr:HAMP domain-containing sensor histidine kinase [Silvanigrella aquatica]APJ02679.1 hypothetical protein AXG55_01530 [Silvanigrella aquatica]
MLKKLNKEEKKIILLFSLSTIIIFSFLYFIINFQDTAKQKEEFITKTAQQLSKNLSNAMKKNDNVLSSHIIQESTILNHVNYLQLKSNDNKEIYNFRNKNLDSSFTIKSCSEEINNEIIYFENKIIGSLSYCRLSSSLNIKYLNILVFLLLLITLSILIGFFIISKKNNENFEIEKNQIKSFIAHIAKLFNHDIRKPFNLMAMLLRNNNSPNENSLENNQINKIIIDEIEKSKIHLEQLIEDIVHFSTNFQLNNENNLLTEAINNSIKKLKNNKFNFTEIASLDESVILSMDKHRIEIAFTKILKYIIDTDLPENKINIETMKVDFKGKLYIQISFSNKNYHICEKKIKIALNLFYLEKTKNNFGLDLAICKKITEAHNGMIKYKSKKSTGTEFIMILPIHSF